ncbi:MAG: hypothetical protein UHI85_06400 [Turicibacter sp.]|nr:hypothetical protein [Turicibacter sp.]
MSTSRQLNRYWTLPHQQKFLSRFSQLLGQGFSIAQALEVMSSLFNKENINIYFQIGFVFKFVWLISLRS